MQVIVANSVLHRLTEQYADAYAYRVKPIGMRCDLSLLLLPIWGNILYAFDSVEASESKQLPDVARLTAYQCGPGSLYTTPNA